jgi:hypothetical protein
MAVTEENVGKICGGRSASARGSALSPCCRLPYGQMPGELVWNNVLRYFMSDRCVYCPRCFTVYRPVSSPLGEIEFFRVIR